MLACKRRAPGCAICRGGRPVWADQSGWFRAPPWLGFLPAWWSLLRDFRACVLHLLHLPNALVHSFACIIGPSTWCSCFESCPCSLASLDSHATMNFLQSHACYPRILVLCMWSWWKLLKGHPMMYYGACMIKLTRLPPSKHILRLNTPRILKIKNNFRATGKLKHKFREVFKPLNNVSRKYVPTTFILVSPVSFAFISWEETFSVWSWGHRFRF
jgi:hypothetical protein